MGIERVMTDIIKLPGLIDLHVHLRDPGQTEKEDFYTGTAAALAGGYTTIFDMPNNAEPVTTVARLKQKMEIAKSKIVADLGFHFGSLGDNLDEFEEAKTLACGLKLYLNVTTGNYLLDPGKLLEIFQRWNSKKPILLHAEADIIKTALQITKQTKQPTHVCHVSCKDELEPIIEAKKAGVNVTCGVTPHHLFLTDFDEKRLGNFGLMKPSLKPQSDQDYLWANLDYVDVIESDHAPHTKEQKAEGTFGVPGLESMLPLMLLAESQGRISREDLIKKCYTNPKTIIGLSEDPSTYIEVKAEAYNFSNANLKTKCGWSPFDGHPVFGKISKVVIRDKLVFQDGNILAKPGEARVISTTV
jgi:dihydroorotase